MRSDRWHRCPHCRTINSGRVGPDASCVKCRQSTLCPCPACGTPLTDHSAICSDCKQPLSWRGNYPRSSALDFLDRQTSHQAPRDEAAYELTIEFLQPELARRLIGRHNATITSVQNRSSATQSAIVLRSLHSLTPEVASELRFAIGSIHLPDLARLSPDAARRFATHEAALHLDGLTDLDPSVAAALAKHPGRLSFGNIDSITKEVAVALSEHTGDLALHGLKCIDEDAAQALSRHKGRLELDRLDETITPLCLQARLYSRSNELHKFTAGLTNLTPEFGRLLSAACRNAPLILDGITHLDADLAKELVTGTPCLLSLNGLRELTDKAAAALGKFPGQLLLNGIERISDTQMHFLTQSSAPPQRLSLRRLSRLPTRWFPRQGGEQWNLHLYGLSVDSLESARKLAGFPGKLHVDRGNWMTVEVLEVFQDGSTRLVVHDIPSVPTEVRKKIEESPDGRVCFPPPKSELERILTKIRKRSGSPAAGQETIELQETTRLTQSAASVLATWPGELIFHQDIHLTSGIASRLAASKGTLHFKKQSELRTDALQHLIRHSGKILMYGSYEIRRQHIEILSHKTLGAFSLDPVCAMLLPKDQQSQLSTNPRVHFRFKSGFDGG